MDLVGVQRVAGALSTSYSFLLPTPSGESAMGPDTVTFSRLIFTHRVNDITRCAGIEHPSLVITDLLVQGYESPAL